MFEAIYETISSFSNKRSCKQTLDKNSRSNAVTFFIKIRLSRKKLFFIHLVKASEIFQTNGGD